VSSVHDIWPHKGVCALPLTGGCVISVLRTAHQRRYRNSVTRIDAATVVSVMAINSFAKGAGSRD